MSPLEIVLGVGGLVLGVFNTWLMFVIKSLKEQVSESKRSLEDDINGLRTADNTMAEKMAAVRELVAGQYVTRAQFETAMDAQTDRIMARMDEMFRYLRPPGEGMHG